MLEKYTHIPVEKRILLAEILQRLQAVEGMAAIVLGGSYASRTQHAASDMDIGLYYYEREPFAITDIRHVAQSIALDDDPTVTGFYEWGAWVNGGAWIHTAHGKVDFLYRNINQIQRTITDAQQGICHHDYDQQPTNGFYSVIYLAETQICLPLYDPDTIIAQLKQEVAAYPPKLREKIVADSLWAAEFTLLHARGFAAQGDVYNTTGCLVRAAANLTQTLFALNERYFMRDKQVMDTIAAFPLSPVGYSEQVGAVLSHPGKDKETLENSVKAMETAWQAVAALPGSNYIPKFVL